jgi:4-amino-4-deoxy-L-arabinose transferase-like glycosyltransferase
MNGLHGHAMLNAFLPLKSVARMHWLACAFAAACGGLLFVRWAWIHPLVLWDESRLAVNAIEMSQSGLSLVTTYGFQPDLWNTKPPLMIWLMVGSLKLFGPAEWALRLPALLAATGTIAVVIQFTHQIARSAVAALFAGVLLATSPTFFGVHVAVTADYDALLCLFTTASSCLLFHEFHRARPRPSRVLAAAVLVIAAVLTKGIAGLIPAAGIAAYLTAVHRWNRLHERPVYVAAAVCTLAAVCTFYVSRECVAPGYLAAVSRNELGGRYLSTIEGHAGPRLYYLSLLANGGFSLSTVGLLTPLALAVARVRVRAGLAFSSCVSFSVLAVLSLGATKIAWYAAPVLPFMSISAALAGVAIARALTIRMPQNTSLLRQSAVGACVVISAYCLAQAILVQYGDAYVDFEHEARYGKLLTELERRGVRDVLIFDSSFRDNYAPRLRYYSQVAALDGLHVKLVTSRDYSGSLPSTGAIASCDRTSIPAVRKFGGMSIDVGLCAAALVREDGARSQWGS